MIPSQVCIINCRGIWLKTASWVGEDDDIADKTSSSDASYSTNTSCYSSCCIEERARELASKLLEYVIPAAATPSQNNPG